MKRKFNRILCALLALLMAAAPVCAAEEWDWGWFASEPEPTAAPARSHEGNVRVLLSSLGTPETVHLTLQGVYSVENDAGFTFAEGAEVVLSAVDDCVYMVTGALTMALGGEVTFTRHPDAEGNLGGIVIAQAGGNLYPGDLTVWASAGGLTMRLTTSMEEYLPGVVAYEMSDAFPMEALKAQAVAARTYALQRMWHAQKRQYDLVDTPQDQVYRGVNGEYANVTRAVEETKGVCGFYKDAPAVCYFTASNGGQTALATDIWGGSGDYGYLAVKDDPYDMENPKSLVNSCDVYADYAANGPELRALLEARLPEAMKDAGQPGAEARIVQIANVEAVQPRFENTRQFEKVRFTVNAQVLQEMKVPLPPKTYPEWMLKLMPQLNETQYETRQVAFDVPGIVIELDGYRDIKKTLSLGLNSSDYEMLSVETADAGWRVCMRRFGHGVGMSQRGAQQMASQHGMGYRDILKFYYPGMDFETVLWTYQPVHLEDAAVTLLRSRGISGTADGLGELQEGERHARVQLSSASSSLNLRAEPNTQAEILAVLINGSRLVVTEEGADGWCRVRTAVAEGYVKAEYLVFTD